MMTSPAHVVDNIAYFQEREWADLHRRNVNWTGQAISIKDWAYVWLRRQLRRASYVYVWLLVYVFLSLLYVPVTETKVDMENRVSWKYSRQLSYKFVSHIFCLFAWQKFPLSSRKASVGQSACTNVSGIAKLSLWAYRLRRQLPCLDVFGLSSILPGFLAPPRVRGVGDQPALKYWCLRFYFVTWLSDQQVCQRSQRIGQHTTHSPDLLQVLAQLCYLKTKSAYSRLR